MSDSVTNRGKLSGLRFQCPYLPTFRLITVLNSPFSLLTPTVCQPHSFVFLSVHFTLSIRRQHHSSNDSIILASSFFSVQLSLPYNTTHQTSDLTRRCSHRKTGSFAPCVHVSHVTFYAPPWRSILFSSCPFATEVVVSVRNGSQFDWGTIWDLRLAGYTSATHTFLVYNLNL